MQESCKVFFNNADANKQAFNARVKRHDFCWNSGTERLKGDFLYLPFRDGKVTVDEFLRFIIQETIKYALPYSERETAYKESSPSNFSPSSAIRNKVKSLFQSGANASEFGELILYIVLRDFFDAPQIVSKMVLKTSGNMPVHGADGLHIKFDNNTMLLYFGESKMYSKTSPHKAINDAIESSAPFLTNNKPLNGVNARDFEINLINSHFSLPDCSAEQKAAILSYFNPQKEQYNNSKNIAVCLVGFNMKFYNNIQFTTDIDKQFRDAYEKQIISSTEYFEQKIKEKRLNDYNFHFLLLPFKSITDFRDKFLEALDEL